MVTSSCIRNKGGIGLVLKDCIKLLQFGLIDAFRLSDIWGQVGALNDPYYREAV